MAVPTTVLVNKETIETRLFPGKKRARAVVAGPVQYNDNATAPAPEERNERVERKDDAVTGTAVEQAATRNPWELATREEYHIARQLAKTLKERLDGWQGEPPYWGRSIRAIHYAITDEYGSGRLTNAQFDLLVKVNQEVTNG